MVFPVLALILVSSCTQEKVDIKAACEATPDGNYLVKWETFPPLQGNVKIYESLNPDSFKLNSPMVETAINQHLKSLVAIRPQRRSYFKLVFNDRYSVISAERCIPMKVIYNFRDLGGYYNENERQTRWGKIYRSSSLQQPGAEADFGTLANLGIKTVIDFDKPKLPYKYAVPPSQLALLPLRGNPDASTFYFNKILSGELKRIDVIIIRQDAMLFLLQNNSDYFARMFDILLDRNNYPIVMNCAHGTERSGLAAALILAALGVDKEQIISDYTLSDTYIDYLRLLPNADSFGPDIQETITAIISAHREVITYVLDRTVKDYGSLDRYLEDVLKMTPKKREKLKEILLYKNNE
ncbi:MAG: tyrosine-protein phosphatase [Dysgonamonadaceae bacterium]|nr:tyrosine-protein phosphatase [Dysgonamonadaceae bacterium]